jgi:hypothetical protein
VSARGLFLLFYVGITGLLSASVFGLLIVRDGGLLFCRIVRLAPYQRSCCMVRMDFFFLLLLVFWLHSLVFHKPFCS